MRADVLPPSVTNDNKRDHDEEHTEDDTPPGAAASWPAVDHEQTTSKSTDTVIVTSPVC